MKSRQYILVSIFFMLGFGLCLLISYYRPFFSGPSPRSLRHAQGEYPLINPVLLCNINQVNTKEDSELENSLKNYIKSAVNQGKAEKVSMYVLEYGSGKYIGINENDQYDPASLLKVPLMIAYYGLAEKNPQILSQKTSFNGDDQNSGEFFKSSHNILPGVSYTIHDLIQSMIVNSDNTATILLNNYVDTASLSSIYGALGLNVPSNDASVHSLSVKSYAEFFRILYNGTYLNHSDSEKALELLSQVNFSYGLRAGVPVGVTVAQKFGERSVYNTAGTLVDRELHDCGIVYKENNHYLVCVMTQGQDFNDLAATIKGLSSIVYSGIQ